MANDDEILWAAFCEGVTPLGNPEPSQPFSPPPTFLQAPEMDCLDLHGLSVANAYSATKDFLDSIRVVHKTVTVITGLSGEIKREFPFWIENNRAIRRIEELDGGGAYRIHFKKK